ncbi:MAG: Nramp family divalent metal transporter [Patescibacteria group bacterium]|nr:Nramp family divalent metal transporter [Patescibacteria group bacterium]
MNQETMSFPEVPAALRNLSVRNILQYFGPGAVLAALTIGSGETIFASRGGAIFGYAIMWSFVFGALMKAFQTYSATRYITLTGEHPIIRWSFLPGPRHWFPLMLAIIVFVCFPGWIGGLIKMLGILCTWITGIWNYQIWGTLFIGFFAIMHFKGRYSLMENVQKTVISILMVTIIIATLAARPDWGALLKGTFLTIMPADYEPWVHVKYPAICNRSLWIEIITYFGAIGGGAYDYLGYVGMLSETKWGALGITNLEAWQNRLASIGVQKGTYLPLPITEEEIEKGKKWLRAPVVDICISFIVLLIFTLGFMVCGAAILYPNQLIPDGMEVVQHQAKFFENIHPSLRVVYQAGIFTAFFGTIFGGFGVYPRTFHEATKLIRPWAKSLDEIRPFVIIYCSLGGILLLWTVDNPIAIVTPGAILGGVFACGLWCFAMLWTDKKFLPKPYQMSVILSLLVYISGILLTIIGIIGIIDYIRTVLL